MGERIKTIDVDDIIKNLMDTFVITEALGHEWFKPILQ